jgi:hypothetical protein
MKYSVSNVLDECIVSASDFVIGFEPKQVQTHIVGIPWRINDLDQVEGGAWIEFTSSTQKVAQIFAIQRPRSRNIDDAKAIGRLRSTDLIRYRAWSDEQKTQLVYDSGSITLNMVDGTGFHGHLLSDPITFRVLRIDITATSKTGALDNYFEIGRIWGGVFESLKVGFSSPYAIGWDSLSSFQRPATGASYFPRHAAPYRRASMNFSSVLSDERNQIIRLMNNISSLHQFLIAPLDGEPEQNWLFCAVDSPALAMEQVTRGFSRLTLNLQEAI